MELIAARACHEISNYARDNCRILPAHHSLQPELLQSNCEDNVLEEDSSV